MPPHTDDLRIRGFAPLSAPAELLRELPCTEPMSDTVAGARRALHAILHGEDDRLAVVIGPCSIHDPQGGHGLCKAAASRCASRSATRSRS